MTIDKASLFYFLRPLVENEHFMAEWENERRLLLERVVRSKDLEDQNNNLNLVRALDMIKGMVTSGAAKTNQPKG
jgi:hypothetical protein